MSILGDMFGKVFGATPAQAAEAAPAPQAAAPAATAAAPVAPAVDYEAVLDAMNENNPETLDWRSSIVDLLKVLGMDSSLAARKLLAQELNYHGNVNDSGAMNVWLHQQVMAKFAENGGKMPKL